jgi:hypothetical protein
MLDARFWRIGFTFATHGLCDAFAQIVVRRATGRLASELFGLQRILERFNPKTVGRELRIVPDPRDRRFEHLILDILNEDDRHAKVATLVDDFLEKTDLRVQYPGLKRRRGSRVQVTSTVAPEHHKTKLEAIKAVEEYVFLSPLSLAEFVNHLQDHAPAISISETPLFTLAPLWDCLEVKPADVRQLASELKRIMFRALTGTPDSPLGPMAQVPLPIRRLIRLFVETRAIESTNTLRERENDELRRGISPHWFLKRRRRSRSDLAASENGSGPVRRAVLQPDDVLLECLRAVDIDDGECDLADVIEVEGSCGTSL